jgi:hypothetical protein
MRLLVKNLSAKVVVFIDINKYIRHFVNKWEIIDNVCLKKKYYLCSVVSNNIKYPKNAYEKLIPIVGIVLVYDGLCYYVQLPCIY